MTCLTVDPPVLRPGAVAASLVSYRWSCNDEDKLCSLRAAAKYSIKTKVTCTNFSAMSQGVPHIPGYLELGGHIEPSVDGYSLGCPRESRISWINYIVLGEHRISYTGNPTDVLGSCVTELTMREKASQTLVALL